MSEPRSLTGVWHGLYSYPAFLDPVFFVATLISSGSSLSGTIHEAVDGYQDAPLTLFASVDGAVSASSVEFKKTYDGTGDWRHSVNYAGILSADGREIEGRWSIPAAWSGRFLMMRGEGLGERAVRRAFENA